MARKDKETKTDEQESKTSEQPETETSEAGEQAADEKSDGNGEDPKSTAMNEEPQITTSCEERYAELNGKYIRLYSDFDNFRKRTIKEKADIITTASADVLKDLLVVLDDFERAVANNEKVEDAGQLREGFRLIQNKLLHVLQGKGLESTDPKGEVFDADKHEAITNIPVTDENQKGKVVDVVERGYTLRGKSLRYAKVIVGQ
jgi:molecular chaperone GrpE